MTTTVVAYTSFCDGHVTRFSSLRTSLRNRRIRSMRPPVASRTVSSVVVSAMALSASDFRLPTSDCETWQARRESNPQPPVLETGALPIELLAYILTLRLQIADCRLLIEMPPVNLQSAL